MTPKSEWGDGHYRDIGPLQQVHRIINKEENYREHGPLCLVYVLSSLQTEDDLEAFTANMTKLTRTGQAAVAVVHNMSVFLPPIAHRIPFEELLVNPSVCLRVFLPDRKS